MEREIFAGLFLLSQRLEYITDSILKQDKEALTTKQLLASITIMVDEKGIPRTQPASISDVAESLSTSHQNVKQIAKQLESKGFLQIVKDEKDRRRKLLTLTSRSQEYWAKRADRDTETMASFFTSLDTSEVTALRKILMKLLQRTEPMYKQTRGIK